VVVALKHPSMPTKLQTVSVGFGCRGHASTQEPKLTAFER
jgi:hypothetical protein